MGTLRKRYLFIRGYLSKLVPPDKTAPTKASVLRRAPVLYVVGSDGVPVLSGSSVLEDTDSDRTLASQETTLVYGFMLISHRIDSLQQLVTRRRGGIKLRLLA